MPLYFAYGLNMSREGMAARCPGATALGRARLAGHRFTVMANGYASVRRDRTGAVHGVLWEIAPAHVRALDVFEEVGRGLYVKAQQPVIPEGGAAKRALLYLGVEGAPGRAPPGTMEALLDAAAQAGLPEPYLRELARWLPSGGARREPAAAPVVPKVRPRFADPFDPKR